MKVSFVEVKAVVDTLPIGLYAHRRIECVLDETAECSSYCPSTDSIVLSYPQIANALASTTDESYRESGIRANCYHEVSHAILTPNISGYRVEDWLNILEDERIETILKDFYLDVDFKKNVILTNGGKIEPPTNVMSAFYQLVRYRIGNKDWVDRLEKLIEDKKNITAKNSICKIYSDYRDFWQAFRKEYDKNPEYTCGNPSQEELDEIAENLFNGMGDGQGMYSDNVETSARPTSSAEGEGSSSESDNENKNEGSYGRTCGYIDSGEEYNPFTAENSVFNKFTDTKLTATLEQIITSFNKKNNTGSGICNYSGIFNPRNVTRNDYRYFDRAITTNGNNKFGTFHLNLWIDCSGSFYVNEDAVNTLIRSLAEIEKKNKNFTFDCLFCGEGIHECNTKKDRWLHASENNWLKYDDTQMIFKKYQKNNTFNYNIILFDGDCGAWGHYGYRPGDKNALRVFDKANCSLILERDNKRYAEDLKTARITWCNSNYAGRLTEEITKALTLAFH